MLELAKGVIPTKKLYGVFSSRNGDSYTLVLLYETVRGPNTITIEYGPHYYSTCEGDLKIVHKFLKQNVYK
jgi:hypothetical protein